MLAPPQAQLYAGFSTGTTGPRRNRWPVAHLTGPGLITDAWLSCTSTVNVSDGWNLYYSPVELSTLTDNALTTDLEGYPLIPTGNKLRGVLVIPTVSLSGPAWMPLNLAVPPGAWYLYGVSVYLTGGYNGFAMLLRYVPS